MSIYGGLSPLLIIRRYHLYMAAGRAVAQYNRGFVEQGLCPPARLCEEDLENLSENQQLECVVQLHKQSIVLMIEE